jgi:hypothetical protein
MVRYSWNIFVDKNQGGFPPFEYEDLGKLELNAGKIIENAQKLS